MLFQRRGLLLNLRLQVRDQTVTFLEFTGERFVFEVPCIHDAELYASWIKIVCRSQATFILFLLVFADFSETPAIHIASSTLSMVMCD